MKKYFLLKIEKLTWVLTEEMIFPSKILTSYKYVCLNPEILLRQQILLILLINPLTGSAAPSPTAPPETITTILSAAASALATAPGKEGFVAYIILVGQIVCLKISFRSSRRHRRLRGSAAPPVGRGPPRRRRAVFVAPVHL